MLSSITLTSLVLGAAAAPITLSDSNIARPFDGIGAISGGGATSRLLFDYPDATRSQILDLLFAPQVGAALQQFKVEQPGDADTTCGSEQSHRHNADEAPVFTRGYEGWLLQQAVARNPSIVTSALQWAAPGFVSDGTDSLLMPSDVPYVIEWIHGLRSAYNVSLNVMGCGWNEHPHNSTYIKLLRSEMDAAGLEGVQLAGTDEWRPADAWSIAAEMQADPQLAAAIDTIAVHVAGQLDHGDPPTPAALASGKPLSQAEEHFGLPDPDPVPAWDWAAAGATAIEVNQNWALSNMSSTVFWPAVYGWASGLTYRGKGFIAATSPWGDAPFFVLPPLWIIAHTTHFTSVGSWFLLNATGSGGVPGTGVSPLGGFNVSYVTYVGPPNSSGPRDVTVVVESGFEGAWHAVGGGRGIGAPTTITFQLAGGLSGWAGSSLHVWHSNSSGVLFQREADVMIAADGTFTVTIEPAAVYTFTSVASSHPGAAALMSSMGAALYSTHGDIELGDGPVDAPFPLPWADSFDMYANDSLPLYTSDMYGAFATFVAPGPPRQACAAGVNCACTGPDAVNVHAGRCARAMEAAGGVNQVLRQYVTAPPVGWNTGTSFMVTIIGNYSLSNMMVNVSVLIEQPKAATGTECVLVGVRGGRGSAGATYPSSFYSSNPNAYSAVLYVNGTWALSSGSTLITRGALPGGINYDVWHNVSIADPTTGYVQLWVDDVLVADVSVPGPAQRGGGYVVLGTGVHAAQFDNLLLSPL